MGTILLIRTVETFLGLCYPPPMKHLVTHARSPYRRLAGALNGVLALAAVVAAPLFPGPSSQQEPPPLPGHTLRSGSVDATREWYFRTGQWRADARTLVAVARWCFEGNPVGNPVVPGSNRAGLPNTNSAAVSRT